MTHIPALVLPWCKCGAARDGRILVWSPTASLNSPARKCQPTFKKPDSEEGDEEEIHFQNEYFDGITKDGLLVPKLVGEVEIPKDGEMGRVYCMTQASDHEMWLGTSRGRIVAVDLHTLCLAHPSSRQPLLYPSSPLHTRSVDVLISYCSGSSASVHGPSFSPNSVFGVQVKTNRFVSFAKSNKKLA
jgi:hypothetical protein